MRRSELHYGTAGDVGSTRGRLTAPTRSVLLTVGVTLLTLLPSSPSRPRPPYSFMRVPPVDVPDRFGSAPRWRVRFGRGTDQEQVRLLILAGAGPDIENVPTARVATWP
jgi:hypothetical protein